MRARRRGNANNNSIMTAMLSVVIPTLNAAGNLDRPFKGFERWIGHEVHSTI